MRALKFDTVQSFVTAAAPLMGVTTSVINPQYDPSTHSLSFGTNFQGTSFSKTVPLDFSDGLGPLTYLAPANATFTATPTASARVAVELGGLQTALTASDDGPMDGRLASTAHFTVALNGAAPVTVVVASDVTNINLDDLVADLNSSLAFSGLGGQVTAGHSGNRLTLSSATGSTLHVTAAAGDSAATQLHLVGDGVGTQWGDHVLFTSGAQLNVASTIVGANLSGAAALGILPVTVNPSTVTISSNTAGTLSATTYVGDLKKNADSLLNDAPAVTTLGGHFTLTVDPSLGVSASIPAAFDLGLATPNQLATTVTAAADGPSNGRLNGPASFSLIVGQGTPVATIVPDDATNQTLDDLIADINAAIQTTRLGSSVIAARNGNRLTLSTNGLDSLAIHSDAGSATQTEMRFPNAAANPAVIYVGNTPFQEKLLPLVTFGTTDFTNSLKGILALFSGGQLNHLTSKVPLLNQSIDDVLGISQKLKDVVQQLQSKSGANLKPAVQAIVANLRTAIRGLPSTLPDGATDDLDAIFDVLRIAAQNANRTDITQSVNLASVIVASITPLTQAIAKVNQPGVDLTPLNNVRSSLQQVTPSLLQLPTTFASALNTGSVTSQFVNADPTGFEQAIVVRSSWAPTVVRGMSLGSVKPDGLGPLKFAAGSTANLNVTGDLEFDFGYDFATMTPFLLDTSRFNATTSFGSYNQSFAATIGGVSVTLGNPLAPAVFQLTTATNNVPASLVVTVDPTPHISDIGNIPFANIATALNYSDVNGHFSSTLPVYLTGNNQGNVTIDWDFPGAGAAAAPTITAPPNLIPVLEAQPYNFALFVDGIRDWNDQFERLLSDEALGKLPLVKEGIDISSGFMGQLENQFLNAVQNTITANGGVDSTSFRQALDVAVQTALSGLLVNGTLQVSQTGSPEVRFNLLSRDTYHAGLDLGLPGLNLEFVEPGDVVVDVNYDLQLGFGISKTEGFYFIVEPAAPQLTFNVSASLDPNTPVKGRIFSLPVIATANVDAGMQSLTRINNVELDVAILDPDGKFTSDQLDPSTFVNEFQIVYGAGGADASVDLHLVANNTEPVNGDVDLPEIVTDLRVDQHFAPHVTLDDPGAIPQVQLNNIGLNLGSTLSKIVQPIVDEVNSFLGPIKPVITALNQEVPVLSQLSQRAGSGRVTWIDAVAIYSDDPDVDQTVAAMHQIADLVQALSSLSSQAAALASSTANIVFGDYHFWPTLDLRIADPNQLDPRTAGTFIPRPGFDPTGDGTISPYVRSADSSVGSFLGDELQDDGVRFPIFEDPWNAVPLLFGQDVTLVTWDLPQFEASFRSEDVYLGTIPVGPVPVNVMAGLDFGVGVNVGVGFDTSGFQEGNTFADGFFFQDEGRSAPAVLSFSAGIHVDAAAGIPFVAQVGIEGQLTSTVGGYWKNDDHDDKVHLEELLANLDQGPQCVFDLNGALTAQMFFYIQYTLASVSIPIVPEITLFDFTVGCPPLPPPELAHLSDPTGNPETDFLGGTIPAGSLILNIGPFAPLRTPGHSHDNDERVHVYQYEPGVITVTGFGQVKQYGDAANPITAVYGDAGMGNNVILVDASVTVPTTLLGGEGDDQLRGGSAANLILGRGGKDVLIGGIADDIIESGYGDAKLYGGPGRDRLTALGGNNYIDGDDDDDIIQGGSGNDVVSGGKGDDEIDGGGGTDRIFGEQGNDIIVGQGTAGVYIEGGPGDNQITGSDGADEIWAVRPNAPLLEAGRNTVFASGGNDLVYGGIDNFNEIHGGSGNDVIHSGNFGDWLYGDANDDLIYGGAGNDIIHAGSGKDLIYGFGGGDLIFADSGVNTIYGGIGGDTIFGSSGSVRPVNWPAAVPAGFDTTFAGAGDDTIYGEAGIDFIYGGVGTAYLDGGTFNDFIYGGTGAQTIHGRDGDDYLQTGDGNEQIFGDGGDDLLVQKVAANQKLTDTTLTGRGSDTLLGIERVHLIDTSTTGYALDVGGWTAAATIAGATNGSSTVSAATDADFELADGTLKTSLGGRFSLVNIVRAYLAGVLLDNTMDVSLWTGTATLVGGIGLDQVVSINDASFVLSDTNLTRSTGGNFILSQIKRAVLGGGPSNNTFDAEGFSGNVSLYGGAGDDTLLAGSGDDYLDGGIGTNLLDGRGGNDVLVASVSAGATLIGGSGDDLIYGSEIADVITAGAGRDRVYSRGGDDTVTGGDGDDILDGGAGNDTISGDAGADLIVGAAGNDTLYAFNLGGVGDDGAINYVYGDFGTAGNEPGTGSDTIVGGIGNDQLFGEGGSNTISGGGPGALRVDGLAVGLPAPDPIAPPPVPVPANWPPTLPGQTATLPSGVDERGRWTQYASSATGGGLSNSPAAAIEPSIAVGVSGQFVTWADARSGSFQIYAALHTNIGWEELAGSAEAAGISAATSSARRPSITLDATGLPIVAWTQFNGTASDIYVARYDELANSGNGGWVPLGSSLSAGGISGSGRADQAEVVMTSIGPVVAWLDSSSGVSNVYVRRFENGTWVPLGLGSASGNGVSASTTSVADLALTSDGNDVAVAWSQNRGGRTQIYLRQYDGATWSGLGGSATGDGLSGTSGNAAAASLAYENGLLYAAWQDNTSGHNEIYAAMFDGNNWLAAGEGSITEGGISATVGDATRPQLSAASGQLFLAWLDNRLANFTGNTTAIYVKQWDGMAFTEELPGDASNRGIANMVGNAQAPALAVDGAGHPFVAWSETEAGNRDIYFRANTFDIGTIHYVNDGDIGDGDALGNSVATAPGSDANDGLSVATAKLTLQAILDDGAHPLNPGDVIVIDAGSYNDSAAITASANGVLILGSPNEPAIVNGLISLTITSNVTLDHLTLASGVRVSGGTSSTITGNTVQGMGITLVGSSLAQIVHNIVTVNGAGLTLTGMVQDAVVEHNTVVAGARGIWLNGAGSSGLTIDQNRIGGAGSGITIDRAAGGQISGNRIESAATGMSLNASFSGLLADNEIARAGVGVSYAIAALLSGNRIHDNAIGVRSTVSNAADGLGYFGVTQPNQFYKNDTGVNLVGAVMQGQHVFANTTGVSGSGSLIPLDFDHANLIETNTVGVDFSGPVQFNRIARNSVGINARSGQLIAHNTLYGNTVGVNVQGVSDVRIFNNTMYTAAGDNIRAGSVSDQVEVRNNTLWTENGYDIFVDDNSTVGFFSDYNDLHAGSSGKLVYWTKDFNDILDWQEDVHQFDLHSIGRTVVNPDWSQPRFVSLSLNDYRIFDETARQRFSSPTIDLADARSDQALPLSYQNLLGNPSFESGLSGWTASPSGATQGSGPSPWDGTSYFSASVNPVTTLDQQVDLVAAGLLPADIDSKNLSLVFGGRARSANETPVDTGTITLTFLDDGNAVVKTITTAAGNVNECWELIGDRTFIPVGARSVNFRYTAVRRSGTTNDVYLDGAFLYVQADNVQPNLGADGNTYVETSQNINQHLVLRSPDLYTDWLHDAPLKIRWDSFGNTAKAPVRIDLYQDGPSGPQFLLNIAPTAPDTGEYIWIAANDGVNFGTYGLRIRISIVGNETIADRSTETFTVPENTQSLHTYFVNNASMVNDEYTSAVGSNRNTGLLPDRPKPYLNNILRIYTLGPNDVVSVDTGDYPELYPTLISPLSGIGDDAGFVLTGPTNSGRVASFSPANPQYRPAPVLELSDADSMTISHFTIFGGTMGLWAHDGTTNLVANYLNIHDNSQEGFRVDGVRNSFGIRIDSGTAVSELGNSTLVHNGFGSVSNHQSGIFIDGLIGRLHDTSVTYSGDRGISLIDPGAARIEANVSAHNAGSGLSIVNSEYEQPTAIVGNANLSLGLGNIFDDNNGSGISASGAVLVAGNTVSNTRGVFNVGISATGAGYPTGVEVASNAVYNNYRGIQGARLTHNNRVYHNTEIGILNSGQIDENVVYSNDVGIYTQYGLRNNLVYANSFRGIYLYSTGFAGFQVDVVNNTVYQPQGDAIFIDRATANVHLRNNLLWAENAAGRLDAGYALVVDSTSQQGFTSDYNILHASGAGKVALWQGVSRPTLSSWQSTTFQDSNSVSQDPLLVNPLGVDGKLGYFDSVRDGRDDDFHEQSLNGSFHGSSLAPIVGANGLPVFPSVIATADTSQSPAIDRGAPADSYAREPAPNGSFINLGAYGNTALASLSPAEYVLVTKADGGETWPQDHTFEITWRSQDTASTVKIELLRQATVEDPISVVMLIAATAPNSGSFSWTIPTSLTPADDYLIRITRNDNAALSDDSNSYFTIAAPVNVYYVNDGSVNTAGDWTTTAGNNAFDALSPDSPKASIGAVLAAYQLNAGDIIRVDDGTYPQGVNIVLNASMSGITIEGYHDAAFPERHALIDRGNPNFGSAAFELGNAANVSIDQLWITGAYSAIYGPSNAGSTGLTVSNSTLFGNQYSGIQLLGGNNYATLVGNTTYGIRDGAFSQRQSIGIQADGNDTVITQNTVYDTENTGIQAFGARASVNANHVFASSVGVTVQTPGPTVYSPSLQSLVLDNTVHDTIVGISANGTIVVSGNTVYGDLNNPNQFGSTGIVTGVYVETFENTVYENHVGIRGGGWIHDNRVFRNTTSGIQALANSGRTELFPNGTIDHNVVYANQVGIEITSFSSANGDDTIRNNLVYDNSVHGIYLNGYHIGTADVANNTIYQPQGNAIRIESSFSNAHLQNNVLWAASGYDISVDPASEVGFQSDYNNLYTTGTGQIGSWENRPFSRLVDWSYELGLDRHSQSTNPQFVNATGPDGILGYSTTTVGAARILDNTSPGFTLSGDWDHVDQTLGSGGSFLESAPINGNANAGWSFAATAVIGGQTLTYPVSAYWNANRGLGSATYAYVASYDLNWISAGQQMHGIFTVGPADFFTVNQSGTGAGYRSLGDLVLNVPNPSHDAATQVTGSLGLTVSVHGGQNFIADALTVNGQTVEEGNPQGTWIQGGLAGDYDRRAAGGREEVASWTVTGLTPGAFYEVSSTWLAYSTLSSKARYFISGGETVERQISIDQTIAPNDFTDAGVGWKRIAIVQATADTMTVKLSAQADGAVIADAIRIQEIEGDTALDDDFHLLSSSASVDRGNPVSYHYAESLPSGDRDDLVLTATRRKRPPAQAKSCRWFRQAASRSYRSVNKYRSHGARPD